MPFDHAPMITRIMLKDVRAGRACTSESIPTGCNVVIVGESPPPKQTDVEKTGVGRLAKLSGDADFLSRPFVRVVNVNKSNPGTRNRGSKAPGRREAKLAAANYYDLSNELRPLRKSRAVVFILLGNGVAIAFSMYTEKYYRSSPYQLYEFPELILTDPSRYWEEPKRVQRFLVRIPHPSNANPMRYDKERVRNLLTAVRHLAIQNNT